MTYHHESGHPKGEGPPLALQIVFLGKHLDHLIEQRLAAHGLNRTQALTLIALGHHEGLTGMALCAHARVEPANVSRTLQSLERLDLVERRPHPTDGRAQLFYLTADGRSTAETMGQTMQQLSSEILDGVSEEELRSLQIGLGGIWRTIRRRLEAYSSQLSAIADQPGTSGPKGEASAEPSGAKASQPGVASELASDADDPHPNPLPLGEWAGTVALPEGEGARRPGVDRDNFDVERR